MSTPGIRRVPAFITAITVSAAVLILPGVLWGGGRRVTEEVPAERAAEALRGVANLADGARSGLDWHWGPPTDRDRNGWRRFVSATGHFSLRAPSRVSIEVAEGSVVRQLSDYHTFEFGSSTAELTFTLYYADVPLGHVDDTKRKETLGWAIRWLVRSSEGTLAEDRGVVHRALGAGGRFPCRDAVVRVTGGDLTVRFCVVGDRLFELFVGSSPGNRDNVLIDAFIGSFKVSTK